MDVPRDLGPHFTWSWQPCHARGNGLPGDAFPGRMTSTSPTYICVRLSITCNKITWEYMVCLPMRSRKWCSSSWRCCSIMKVDSNMAKLIVSRSSLNRVIGCQIWILQPPEGVCIPLNSITINGLVHCYGKYVQKFVNPFIMDLLTLWRHIMLGPLDLYLDDHD